MENYTTSEFIKNCLTKTTNYIDSLSSERRIHHRYVIEREMLNANIACADMNTKQLKRFDKELLDKLKYLDWCSTQEESNHVD